MPGDELGDLRGDLDRPRVPFVDLGLQPLVRPDGRCGGARAWIRPDLRHRRSLSFAAVPEPELPPGLLGRATAEPGVTYLALRGLWRAMAFALGVRLVLEGAEQLPRDAH